jgi:Zn-dependent peptidase ImmA (M78 family)
MASGYSLEQLAVQMAEEGVQITRAALSNYEGDKRVPAPGILRAVARVLGVSPQYFLSSPQASVSWLAFRCTSKLGVKRTEQIKAYATMEAEKAVMLFDLMPGVDRLEFPKRRTVRTMEDADRAAAELRRKWNLGDAPVECLCQAAEDHGAIVTEIADEGGTTFDGLSGFVNGNRPLLTVNTHVPVDRLRFNLAHEIGHVLMDTDELSRKESEGLAHRFGSSFLVPPPVVKQELGERRQALSFEELGMLKCKYGMSMAAWMYAAKAHGIIPESRYRSLCVEFGRRGWKRKEPVEYVGQETPVRLRQLTARALAEELIDAGQAERLCPGLGKQHASESRTPESLTASLLRTFPAKLRDQVLREAAVSAAHDYETDPDLTDFESFE